MVFRFILQLFKSQNRIGTKSQHSNFKFLIPLENWPTHTHKQTNYCWLGRIDFPFENHHPGPLMDWCVLCVHHSGPNVLARFNTNKFIKNIRRSLKHLPTQPNIRTSCWHLNFFCLSKSISFDQNFNFPPSLFFMPIAVVLYDLNSTEPKKLFSFIMCAVFDCLFNFHPLWAVHVSFLNILFR